MKCILYCYFLDCVLILTYVIFINSQANNCGLLQIISEYYCLSCPARGTSLRFHPLEHLHPLEYHRPDDAILHLAGSTVDLKSFSAGLEFAEVRYGNYVLCLMPIDSWQYLIFCLFFSGSQFSSGWGGGNCIIYMGCRVHVWYLETWKCKFCYTLWLNICSYTKYLNICGKNWFDYGAIFIIRQLL